MSYGESMIVYYINGDNPSKTAEDIVKLQEELNDSAILIDARTVLYKFLDKIVNNSYDKISIKDK